MNYLIFLIQNLPSGSRQSLEQEYSVMYNQIPKTTIC